MALDLAAAGLELLVLDTRTPHALVDSEYATRRAGCEDAARLLGVAALRDVADLDTALARLPDDVMRRRVRHVVTENGRVLAAADLLRAGRVAELAPAAGRLPCLDAGRLRDHRADRGPRRGDGSSRRRARAPG